MNKSTIRPGDSGPQVMDLCTALRCVGYPLEVEREYTGAVVRAVGAFQQDQRLDVDFIVGKHQTWPALEKAKKQEPPKIDSTPRAERLSKALAYLWDPQKWRMRGEYRSSDLAEWKTLERGGSLRFIIPKACDGSGEPGMTCGHAAWFFTTWYLRSINPGLGIYPTWRTGRGPNREFPHRFLPLAPIEGVTYNGVIHRGLSESVIKKFRVTDLRDLADPRFGNHQWYFLQWDPGHVVLVLLCTPQHGFIDPRTGLPARHGAYRFAADGSKTTIGQPWTWKKIVGPDPKEWTAWAMADLDDDGRPPCGPFRDCPDWPLRFESITP